MKRFMIVLAGIFAITATAHASLPLFNQCGCFFGGAEGTFLRPCIADPYFVFRGPVNPVASDAPLGKMLAVEPDFSPGFNVWIGTCLCNGKYDGRFGWQYLHSTDTRTVSVSGPNVLLYVPREHPTRSSDTLFNGFARSRLRFDFDTADLEGGYYKGSCCGLMMRLALGLRYAMIGYRNESRYAGFVDFPQEEFFEGVWRESSWTWGVGPRLAADLHYCLCGGLGLRGLAGVGLLAGVRRSSTRFDKNGEIITNTHTDSVCNALPLLEAKVGLDYSCTCGCTIFRITAGYQVVRYFSALQRVNLVDDISDSAYVLTNPHLDLIGFYIGAEIGF